MSEATDPVPSPPGKNPVPKALPEESFPDKVPGWEVAAYGTGSITAQVPLTNISNMANPVFNVILGVDVAMISTWLAVMQLVDVFWGPVMAQWTDNFRSRWGRRKPFIVAGTILVALAVLCLWMVPSGAKPETYLAWFVVFGFLIYFSMPVFGTSYAALGVELSPDYKERTKITAIRSYFQKGWGMVVPWLFALTQWTIFSSPVVAIHWLSILSALLVLGTGLTAGLLTRERFKHQPGKAPKVPFFQGIVETFRNRPYRQILLAQMCLQIGLMLFDGLGFYVSIYYIFGGDKQEGARWSGYAGTLGNVLAILAVPMMWWLCNRIGKHVTLRLALLLMIIGGIAKWFCWNPAHPWLLLIIPFFYSIGISSVFLVIGTMQMDAVDLDEYHTKRRREAMFGAVGWSVTKIAVAAGIAGSGWIIKLTGFNLELGGHQAPETFVRMRLIGSVCAVVLYTIGFLVLSGYELTEEKMHELRSELEVRRKALA